MNLFRWITAGMAGYGLYRLMRRGDPRQTDAAFAPDEAALDSRNFVQIRDAGPAAMRSKPPDWDAVDEASDESFPASDPPGTY